MMLFFLSALTTTVTAPQANNLLQILSTLTLLAGTGLLTKKLLRKYKRKMLLNILKQKLSNTFNRKSNNNKLFGFNKLAVIVIGLSLLIILGLLVNWFAAFAIVGMLFLIAWVYTSFIATPNN